MSQESALNARIQELEAKLAAATKAAESSLVVKISEKTGAVMVIGLGKFPVTLYREQWGRLLSVQDKIKAVCATAPARKAAAIG